MKKILVTLLAIVLAFGAIACSGKPADNANEVYNGEKCKFVGDENWVTDEAFSLELRSDGTGISKRDGAEFDMTWKLEGEKFTMTETLAGIKLDYSGTLKDGELHIYNGDPESDLTYEYVYKKAN